ncbi:MAG TPA: Rieske (2Fe-2S) protein [Pseudonocardiaceae bacterium]|nr:Rieske (2Fe-2S) protein [Pseudonocardiaceae bacterium]
MKQIVLSDRIATARWLDRIAGAVRDAAGTVLPPGKVKDVLHGLWQGHPVHPALAQFTFGCFTGAALLDVTGVQGAVPLIRYGIAGSVPTAVTGLADYSDAHEEQQRVGVVHGMANLAALLCYVGSLRLRATGRRGGGALALGGFGLLTAAATLGGELSFRWATGPNHAAEVPHAGPADWTDLGPVTDFAHNQPVRRMAGLIPVLVLARDGGFHVLHDRCAHLAAPLHQGEVTDRDGVPCVTCPWHRSVFRMTDGVVLRGPSTAPQPVLDVRVREDRLEVKVREIPGVAAS